MRASELYTTVATMTSPGVHAAAFKDLPDGIAAARTIAQGLIIHEHMTGMYGFDLSAERRETVHLRPIAALIDRVLAEDSRPLTQAREPANRIAGDCRHFTVLAVAILRAHGTPARARCGFGGYFGTGTYEDHWVAEYWNGERWVLADAQIDGLQRETFGIGFDTLDVPRDEFLTAGDAWARCRAGAADPDKFGLSFLNETGYWWIADNLIRDVAALNNMEMLPWDAWGGMLKPGDKPGAEQLDLFDRLAALTADPDAGLAELTSRYASDPRLTVPGTVYNAVLDRFDTISS
jgi:Transglutaminase-like superfamily